jgi:hypothetical protein
MCDLSVVVALTVVSKKANSGFVDDVADDESSLLKLHVAVELYGLNFLSIIIGIQIFQTPSFYIEVMSDVKLSTQF